MFRESLRELEIETTGKVQERFLEKDTVRKNQLDEKDYQKAVETRRKLENITFKREGNRLILTQDYEKANEEFLKEFNRSAGYITFIKQNDQKRKPSPKEAFQKTVTEEYTLLQ